MSLVYFCNFFKTSSTFPVLNRRGASLLTQMFQRHYGTPKGNNCLGAPSQLPLPGTPAYEETQKRIESANKIPFNFVISDVETPTASQRKVEDALQELAKGATTYKDPELREVSKSVLEIFQELYKVSPSLGGRVSKDKI